VGRYDNPDEGEPTGDRYDLRPAVRLPLERPAGFFTPKLSLRYTEYRLDGPEEERLTRTVPSASLDTGLFFERDLALGGRPMLQTLEPRLYYLYTPYRDQADLPLFDTGRYGFSFDSIFRENRFSGPDRVGDANQVTVALTSRLLDGGSGAELLSISIGQIRYFEDRRVTLDAGEAVTEQQSDWAAELNARPNPALNLRASTRWNPYSDEHEELTTEATLRAGPDKVATIGYRFRRHDDPAERTDQIDLTGYWPLARHWRALGRWNYDRDLDQPLERVFGLEYEQCCWAVRLVQRTRLNTSTLESDDSIHLTLTLKGLGDLGRGLDEALERDILGR